MFYPQLVPGCPGNNIQQSDSVHIHSAKGLDYGSWIRRIISAPPLRCLKHLSCRVSATWRIISIVLCQVVLGCARLSQLVSGFVRLCQVVSGCVRLCQVVPG